jgi:PAS domain S-box-containing protein
MVKANRDPARSSASEEYFRTVVQDQTEVICRFRADGVLTFANDVYCRFFGIAAEELCGTHWQPLIHPDDLPMVQAKLWTLGPERPLVMIETRVRSGSGRMHWMQFVNRGFFDAAGRMLEIQSVGRDISERKQAETALLEVHRELEHRIEQLSRLAIEVTLAEERERQSVAHDLHDGIGQILHVVKLKLDALAKGKADGESVAELNALVADASRQVRSLTSQLSPPVLKDLGLIPALHWLAEEIARIYGLQVDIEDECVRILVGPAESAILFRTVRELLINVAKHAQSREARLRMRCPGGVLIITVTDGGIGIADLDAAFAARGHAGGVGLVSVRERIGALGGEMEISSVRGAGTEVTVRMPLKHIENLDMGVGQ